MVKPDFTAKTFHSSVFPKSKIGNPKSKIICPWA
jgi:hypothetical protein